MDGRGGAWYHTGQGMTRCASQIETVENLLRTRFERQIRARQVMPPEAARLAPFPAGLDPRLAAVLREGAALGLDALNAWCAGRLSAYKFPRRLAIVASLPRNAMGKVLKPALRPLLSGGSG